MTNPSPKYNDYTFSDKEPSSPFNPQYLSIKVTPATPKRYPLLIVKNKGQLAILYILRTPQKVTIIKVTPVTLSLKREQKKNKRILLHQQYMIKEFLLLADRLKENTKEFVAPE